MVPIELRSGLKPTGAENVFISPAQLKDMLGQPGVKIVDVRSASDYANRHIQGAVSIPWNIIQVPERDGFRNKWAGDTTIEKIFSEEGLSYEDYIVLYDEGTLGPGIAFAIFSYAGFENLHVLDGGFGAWTGSIDCISFKRMRSHFILSRKQGAFLVDKEYVANRIGDSMVVIIEGRVNAAYEDGHIPTAKHNDPSVFLEDGKFLKPREIILQTLSATGITPDKQIILYCGSGGAASRNFMVLKELGFKNVAIYLNGWDEWSLDPTKIQELNIPNFTFSGSVINDKKSLGPYFFSQSELRTALDQEAVLVLDIRSTADFNIGRIPGSRNVYWNETLDVNRNPKPAEALVSMFSANGVTPDKHVVIFTRGGLQLAYMYTMLKLLGYPKVSAYAGRWDGWESPSWQAVLEK